MAPQAANLPLEISPLADATSIAGETLAFVILVSMPGFGRRGSLVISFNLESIGSAANVDEGMEQPPPNQPPNQQTNPQSIELTMIADLHGLTAKTVDFDSTTGEFTSSPLANIYEGKIARMFLSDWRRFGPLMETIYAKMAPVLGTMEASLPRVVNPVLKNNPLNGTPGYAAREKTWLEFRPVPTLALIDFDDKGMPKMLGMR